MSNARRYLLTVKLQSCLRRANWYLALGRPHDAETFLLLADEIATALEDEL